MFWSKVANNLDPDEVAHHEPPHLDLHCLQIQLFNSPGQSPGRAIVLPPALASAAASALAKSLTLKFFM